MNESNQTATSTIENDRSGVNEGLTHHQPILVVHVRGTVCSGKSRLTARIARLIEEEIGQPYRVISQDGDFIKNYVRENGDQPHTVAETFTRKPGAMKLNPVDIVIIDDNAKADLGDLPNHYITYELK